MCDFAPIHGFSAIGRSSVRERKPGCFVSKAFYSELNSRQSLRSASMPVSAFLNCVHKSPGNLNREADLDLVGLGGVEMEPL